MTEKEKLTKLRNVIDSVVKEVQEGEEGYIGRSLELLSSVRKDIEIFDCRNLINTNSLLTEYERVYSKMDGSQDNTKELSK